MRKIESKFENPIDDILINLCDKTQGFFHNLGFNPNAITTLSLILTILSAIEINNNNFKLAAIYFFVSYIFDCMDGNMARAYNQETDFGDIYDHVSDKFKVILILYVLFKKDSDKFLNFLPLIIASIILPPIHLGCQEKIYDSDESSTLKFTKKMCKNPHKYIKYTRFFGCATWTIFIILVVIYVCIIEKLKIRKCK